MIAASSYASATSRVIVELQHSSSTTASQFIDHCKLHDVSIEYAFEYIPFYIIHANTSQISSLRNDGFRMVTSHSRKANRQALRVNTSAQMNFTDCDRYGIFRSSLESAGIPETQQWEGLSGSGVAIGVLDDGFDLNHPAFQNCIVKGVHDFVKFRKPGEHPEYHGTSVFALLSANQPGTMLGAAPNASYWLGQVYNPGNTDNDDEISWAMGVEWCIKHGVRLINSSLVFDEATPRSSDGSLASRISEAANQRGVILISSAGNSGSSRSSVEAPACYRSNIAVGALSPSGRVATFSSRGPTVDGFLKPEFVAPGEYVRTIGYTNGRLTNVTLDGSSFAAPIVTGAFALLMEARPEWPVERLVQAMQQSASSFVTPNNTAGYGTPWLPDAMRFPFLEIEITARTKTKCDDVTIKLLPINSSDAKSVSFERIDATHFTANQLERGSYLLFVQQGAYTRPPQVVYTGFNQYISIP